MDPSLLIDPVFWNDATPVAAGGFPGGVPSIEPLRGHVLFASSGSTGTPKWIALSKRALLASAAAVNAHLDVARASCWGLALPSRHVGGFGVAARARQAGCRLACFGRRWDAAAFASWLAENRVTHTSLVPTQAHDLARMRVQAPPGLQAVVVGGGCLDTDTGQAVRALGWPVLASYGMTEAASQVATQEWSALDRPYQPAPLRLLSGWRADVTPDGRLRIDGEALFSGILRNDGRSWCFEPRPPGWHQTQDMVALDDGFLTPIGRADLLVKILGELVDPAAVERELARLSGGALAPGSFAVVAVPDARAGHALVPVFDAAHDGPAADAALAAYQAEAPGFRRLRGAIRMRPLPRGPLGKPLRAEITAFATAALAPR